MKIAVSNFRYASMFQSNLNKAALQAKAAAENGAEILVFHEWFLGINPIGTVPNKVTDELGRLARENRLTIVSGGIRFIDEDGSTRVGSFVFDTAGAIVGVQPKIHLYENERQWLAPGRAIAPVVTALGRILILSGADGLDRARALQTVSDHPDLQLIVLQCTEFSEEGALGIQQTAVEMSSLAGCPCVIAGIHGFFYEQECYGQSAVADDGALVALGGAEDDVVNGFEPAGSGDDFEVVDAHVHIIFREPGEVVLDTRVQRLVEKSVDVPVKASILKFMNRAGIDRSVIFDWSGTLEHDYLATNAKVMDLARWSDRFIGFGVPSATDPDVIDRLCELGIRGLKVNPGLQLFYPNSEDFIAVCRRAAEHRLPILIHTGPESAGKLKYDLPLHLDDLAVEVPDLAIIVAHIGVRGFTSEQALMVAEKNPNVYVETSWASDSLIKRALNAIGADRVIFGSDFPSGNPINELAKIQRLKEEGVINQAEYRRIVGGNIKRLLREPACT